MKRMRLGRALIGAAMALLVVSCKESGNDATPKAPGPRVQVNGAGSTFVTPLMSKWATEFQRLNPNVEVYYQSIGSGAGVAQLVANKVQFGATDAPMTDTQLNNAKSPVIHIPLVMGGVVPVYNVPGLAHALRFTPETLSGVFLGEIKTWNDPKLAADNPLLTLPETPITVVHRSEGSGTTFQFTDYLSKVSPTWKTKVGSGATVPWPVGSPAKGNEGVADVVREKQGAIGYVELSYANQKSMLMAELKNSAGAFVAATLDSVAAADFGEVPDDLRYSITNAPGAGAWPISGTTWAVVRQDVASTPEGAAAVDFLRWAAHDGQRLASTLDYAPLPRQLIGRVNGRLKLLAPK